MEKNVKVSIRRAPKFLPFFLVGAVIGAFVGLAIWATTASNQPEGSASIIGYLTLITTIVGAGLGIVLALVFDRISLARSKTVEATKLEESASN